MCLNHDKGVSENNVVALLRLNSDIKVLSIGPRSWENVVQAKRLSGIRLELLSSLEVIII